MHPQVLQRHIVIGEEILLSEAQLPRDNIQTEFDKISLRKIGCESPNTYSYT